MVPYRSICTRRKPCPMNAEAPIARDAAAVEADVRCDVMGAAYRHLYGDSPYAELVPLGVSENDPLDAIPFAPAGLAVDGLVDK
jgi:hypothetical protein